MPSTAEELAIAIGRALGAGDGTPFSAVSTVQSGGQIQQFEISAHPRAFEWTSRDMKTGEDESFDPATLRLASGSSVRELTIERVPGGFPDHVKLAFPSALPIWGRHRDEYRPVSLEQEDGKQVILLRHTADHALFGSLTFDPITVRPTRLVTPSMLLSLTLR